jgi:GNAT superfamily N-acetyltransferase
LGENVTFDSPAPLADDHDRADFSNGRHPGLDEWLCRQAATAAVLGTARTFVVCESGTKRVAGYYALSSGALLRHDMPTAKSRRGLSDPVPVILLARLAVDRIHQGRGLGSSLLVDAIGRARLASRSAGAHALIVHAIDDAAARFYASHGFAATKAASQAMIFVL